MTPEPDPGLLTAFNATRDCRHLQIELERIRSRLADILLLWEDAPDNPSLAALVRSRLIALSEDHPASDNHSYNGIVSYIDTPAGLCRHIFLEKTWPIGTQVTVIREEL